MIFEKYSGNSAFVNIEDIDKNDPYTEIGAKAFLSCKNVYEIKVPDSVCKIGDWAFAHMKELKRIVVPANEIFIGKDAFLDCDNLKEVILYPDSSKNQGLPFLIASCITVLKSPGLVDFKLAADKEEKWHELYDSELVNFILKPDDSGFEPVMVGWFNDEGEDEQLERHIEKVIKDKIHLSLLRLKFDLYLGDDTRSELLKYIGSQVKRQDVPDSLSWKILRDTLEEDVQYVKLAVTEGLISHELMLELTDYYNGRNANAEIVAYLVQALNGSGSDPIEDFEL